MLALAKTMDAEEPSLRASHLSVLQSARPGDVRTDPYPYVVIRNALPEDLYEELARTFPDPGMLNGAGGANNKRWNYLASQVRADRRIPQLWRDFIAYHSSQAFFDDIAELFADHVVRLYPGRFIDSRAVTSLKVGMRDYDRFDSHDVLMDAMFSGNTPVTTATSVRSTHVDRGDKLFSGLFYMRPDDYTAVGGDLTISRFKPQFSTDRAKMAQFKGAYVDDDLVEHVATVPYEKNTLVLFLNSIDALHGVTVRQPSPQTRLFVNLVGELERPLYLVGKTEGPAKFAPVDYKPALKARAKRWVRATVNRMRG